VALKIPFASPRDEWSRLAIFAAAFSSTVVLVQLPIHLWAGNSADFQSSPWQLLGLGGAGVALVSAAFVGLLCRLPTGPRRWSACAICAVGLLAWAQGNFAIGEMNLLDGQHAPIEFASGRSAWTIVAALLTVIIAVAVSRAPGTATFAMGLLAAGLYISSIVSILMSPARRPPYPSHASLYRFSSRENVLVVVLDGLQSSIAADVIRGTSSIANALDGFQYYPDTAGAARTTFLSLPAIHSGAVYSSDQRPGAYFVDAIKRRSFMNRFAAAGFDTVLVNPVESVCPSRVGLCLTGSELLDTAAARLTRESLQLVDLSLFRASPGVLKRYIYNDGDWLTAGSIGVPHNRWHVYEGRQLLEELGNRMTVDDGLPTLKFVHLFSTHPPYVLNDDCRTYSTGSLAHVAAQAKCSLLALVTLLDRLKAADAYDNTVIVVMADHGIDPDAYGVAGDDTAAAWLHLAGAANPLFLMKPRAIRGPLRQMSDAIHVADTGKLVCAQSRTCRAARPVESIATSPARIRRFNDYEWRQEFWHLRTVDKITTYEIRGPVLERSSWSRRP
jgi:hypothetical protein